MKKIGLDIDGVLANFGAGIILAANAQGIGEMFPKSWEDQTTWCPTVDPKDYNKVWNKVHKLEQFWLGLDPFDDAAPSSWDFVPTAYITKRPCESMVSAAWLEKHGFPSAPVVTVGSESKVQACKDYGIEVYIDDKPSNVQELHAAGIEAWLLDRPFNRYYSTPWRLKTLNEIYTKYVVELPPVRQGEIKNGNFVVKDSGQRTVFATGAQRDLQTGKGYFHLVPYIALESLAKLYEAGAEKYGPNNWQKGIPIFAYVNSAIRHVFKLKEGWTDEDHAAAVLWNIAGYIWTLNEVTEGRLSKGLLELTNGLVEEHITHEKA